MASVAADMTFEIGCGIGEFAVGLLSVHANATLIETDQSMRKVDLRRKGGVDAPVADVMDLPFDEEQLNVVVAMWVPTTCPICAVRSSRYAACCVDGLCVAATHGDEHLADLLGKAGGGHSSPSRPSNGHAAFGAEREVLNCGCSRMLSSSQDRGQGPLRRQTVSLMPLGETRPYQLQVHAKPATERGTPGTSSWRSRSTLVSMTPARTILTGAGIAVAAGARA
jgi:hypothetical protein